MTYRQVYRMLISPWWRFTFAGVIAGCGVISATHVPAAEAKTAAYAASGPCATSQAAAAVESSLDCRIDVTMTIASATRHESLKSGLGDRATDITVTEPGGAALTFTVSTTSFEFTGIHVGDHVVVTVWRHEVERFRDGNIDRSTYTAPGQATVSSSVIPWFFVIAAVLVLTSIVEIGLSMHWSRQRRATAPPPLVPLSRASFASEEQRQRYAAMMAAPWQGSTQPPPEREIYHVERPPSA